MYIYAYTCTYVRKLYVAVYITYVHIYTYHAHRYTHISSMSAIIRVTNVSAVCHTRFYELQKSVWRANIRATHACCHAVNNT